MPTGLVSPGNAFVVIPSIRSSIAPLPTQVAALPPSFGKNGACLFAADPQKACHEQIIFWAPEVLPTVLSVGASSSQPSDQPIALDLTGLSPTELRQNTDGWHAVLRVGDTTHRVWMKKLPVAGASQAIELPMDVSFGLRAEAAQSLVRTLSGRSPRPQLPNLPVQRRRRLALVLRALDGSNEGENYRAIAEGLFGKERVPEHAWKTDDLRSHTIRLVQRGLALMRGGYRELLRPKRKDK